VASVIARLSFSLVNDALLFTIVIRNIKPSIGPITNGIASQRDFGTFQKFLLLFCCFSLVFYGGKFGIRFPLQSGEDQELYIYIYKTLYALNSFSLASSPL